MRLKNLIMAVASTVFLLGAVSAQQLQSRPTETGLALEVTYLEGRPPSYQPVPWSNMPRGGTWYALFGRVKGWHLPAGSQPTKAVRVVPYLEGDTVKVTVSVLRGIKFQDVEDMVASYGVRENEELSVAALKKFGVKPFAIKVIRVAPQVSDFPSIVNNTKSVEVVGIEPMVSSFPRYKLSLHNLSDKNISALKVHILVDGKRSITLMPQGDDGEHLIKARSNSELKVPLQTRAQATPGGYEPASPHDQQIVIASLVFEDGTYEGEAESAATYLGFAAGRKTVMKRVLPLLESALLTSTSPEQLRMQLSALSYDADDADVDALAGAFPALDRPRLKSPIEIAMHGVKKDLLDQLDRFPPGQYSPGEFRIWLTGVKDRYANWLARLSPTNISQR